MARRNGSLMPSLHLSMQQHANTCSINLHTIPSKVAAFLCLVLGMHDFTVVAAPVQCPSLTQDAPNEWEFFRCSWPYSARPASAFVQHRPTSHSQPCHALRSLQAEPRNTGSCRRPACLIFSLPMTRIGPPDKSIRLPNQISTGPLRDTRLP